MGGDAGRARPRAPSLLRLRPVDRGENDTETRGRLSLPAALPPASLQNGGRGVKFAADLAPGPPEEPDVP